MHRESLFRAGSSEFPHDNPAVDRGALWIGTSLCSPAADPPAERRRPRRRHADPPPPPAGPTAVSLEKIAEKVQSASAELPDLPLSEPAVQAALETLSPPPEPALAAALETLSAPQEPATAAALETLSPPQEPAPAAAPGEPEAPSKPAAFTIFMDAVVDVTREHGGTRAAAQVAILLDGDAPEVGDEAAALLVDGRILEQGTLRPTESFLKLAQAWKSALSSDGGDLSGCGETTLDNWTADLVSRLLVAPAKAGTIRRDLRRHGIAAFGLLE
jgi:hypothetical protein